MKRVLRYFMNVFQCQKLSVNGFSSPPSTIQEQPVKKRKLEVLTCGTAAANGGCLDLDPIVKEEQLAEDHDDCSDKDDP